MSRFTRWETSSSRPTTASRAEVWARWTTASAWSEDDPGCRWAELEEPVAVGSTGKVKSTGPAQKIRFTEVVPGERMSFTIALPGAVMELPHSMEEVDGTLVVTHGVTMNGPLAGILGIVVGRGLAKELPTVVRLVTENAVLSRTP